MRVASHARTTCDSVSAEITTAEYREMCLEVSVNHHDPADVAATFLADNELP